MVRATVSPQGPAPYNITPSELTSEEEWRGEVMEEVTPGRSVYAGYREYSETAQAVPRNEMKLEVLLNVSK
jgi:hypothetical protein